MPSRHTFTIKPIRELIQKYVGDGKNWIDPFAGFNSTAEFRNDLNPNAPTEHHMEAEEFCRMAEGQFDGALFDPPYSSRQIKECYEHIGIEAHGNYTTSNFYWKVKRAIAPKIKTGGYAISFGWNTSGFGKKLGFEIAEILLVAHGASHNDTIVTVEQKKP